MIARLRWPIDLGEHSVNLGDGQYIGQLTADFGRVDELGRKAVDPVVDQQIGEKALDSAQNARLRRLLDPLVVQIRQKRLDMLLAHLLGIGNRKLALHVGGHLSQIAEIGLDRIVGQFFLELDVIGVSLDFVFPSNHEASGFCSQNYYFCSAMQTIRQR